MSKEKAVQAEYPEAFISISRKDDFTFLLVERRNGIEKVLLGEIFPIVLDRAREWFIKECKL